MPTATTKLTTLERGRKLISRFRRLRDRSRRNVALLEHLDTLDVSTLPENDQHNATGARLDRYEILCRRFARARLALARFTIRHTGVRLGRMESDFDPDQFPPITLRVDDALVVVIATDNDKLNRFDVQLIDLDAVPTLGDCPRPVVSRNN